GVFLRMAKALREFLAEKANSSTNDTPLKLLPRVEVSWGELLDKLTILEIKAERITSAASAANVRRHLEYLKSELATRGPLLLPVEKKRGSLRAINEKLWDLEDAIRACEAEQRFDAHFVELARNIYTFNDARAKLKQEINTLTKSPLVE